MDDITDLGFDDASFDEGWNHDLDSLDIEDADEYDFMSEHFSTEDCYLQSSVQSDSSVVVMDSTQNCGLGASISFQGGLDLKPSYDYDYEIRHQKELFVDSLNQVTKSNDVDDIKYNIERAQDALRNEKSWKQLKFDASMDAQRLNDEYNALTRQYDIVSGKIG